MAKTTPAQRVGCLPLLVAILAAAAAFGLVVWGMIQANASPQLTQIVATTVGIAVALALLRRARRPRPSP